MTNYFRKDDGTKPDLRWEGRDLVCNLCGRRMTPKPSSAISIASRNTGLAIASMGRHIEAHRKDTKAVSA